ncbi:uncharacterized protein UBRO2_00164 [Ustilago bromivora]|uniref:Uncharacterized protein n=1 Tax=Ustilago bromivora TaxID=307758 RepID=A0A8H8TMU3_9BASI|nr:uncharacterized protein UBRO2_00164 [Ustilago bromivora]
MMHRSFSTSATRACAMGDQRVASRVPRLAAKIAPTASVSHGTPSIGSFVQPGSNSSESYTSRRSVSEAFGMLAGSTASSRTGLRSRHASTWAQTAVAPARSFSTSSSAQGIKETVKNKVVEEGKKFAKETVDAKLNSEETKQQAKNMSSSTSKILFVGLAVAGAAYHFMGGTAHAEEARKSDGSGSGPKYTKDQSIDELASILSSRANSKKRTSLILDNFPNTLEDAQRIEKELVPIFRFSFYDLPLKDFGKRLPKSTSGEDKKKVGEFKKYTENLEPLVKKYRHQGNIYEISADWDSADEVWEQVEAKTEQIL